MSAACESHDYRIAYGLFLLASAVYLWGLAPTIAWRDASEFPTAVHLLGITHPAGSPAYTLMAKLLTFVPVGSLAVRVNLCSAVFGALTVSLVFVLLARLLASTPQGVRWCAAVSGALFLLVSESFWRFSEVAEVYTLQNCLIVVLILLLLRARAAHQETPTSPERFYWLFAFVYGLSAGVHATMALFAPAFLCFLGYTAPRMFWGKRLAFLTFFFLLGFAVYLYLPVRSLSEPALDWGDTETWRQFVNHITDRKDAAMHFTLPGPKMPSQLWHYWHNLTNEFSVLGCVLGVIGLGAMWRRDKSLSVLLGLMFLGHVGFFIRSWTAAFGFLPSFVIWALWIGFGVHACLTFLLAISRGHWFGFARLALSTCLLGSVVLTISQNGWRHADAANQTENYSAEAYGKHLLEQFPPDTIFFSSYAWFPLLYLQQVERRRPDLTLLLQSEMFYPSHFAFLSKERFPYVTLVTSDTPVQMSVVEYFWAFCRLNHQAHPFFWEPDGQFQKLLEPYLRPHGLLFAFTPWQEVTLTAAVRQTHKDVVAQATQQIMHGTHDVEARALLAEKLNFLGLYFQRRDFAADAAAMYQVGFLLAPHRFDLRNNYGGLLLSQKHFPEALEQLQAAYHQEPYNPTVNKNLGLLFLLWEKPTQATRFFERALTLEYAPWDTLAFLGETYIQLGRFPEAIQALQAVLTQYQEGSAQKPDIPESLSTTIIGWARENLHSLSQGRTSKLIPHPFLRRADSSPN